MASAVADFYTDRCILVTGFTGFVGKVLVEKLLRSVSSLKSIYVLIRPLNGCDAKQRLEKVLDSDLFDLIRKSGKDAFSKLIPVNGDITEPGLGLTPDMAKSICDQVSVVFHCAATVKFDEHMRLAVRMNVEGTKSLLDVCQKMKHLDAFVHTSTAYCNCDRTHIVERVYPSPIPWQKLIDSVQWMDNSMLDRLSPLWIGSRPNSYTFTKAVAESMLIDESHTHLPIVIVRPSIVTAVWKEPIPGWIDNYNGATGLIALGAKGLIKTMYGRLNELRADLVPVDIVVNMLIIAGWYQGIGAGRPMPVIHCTTGRLNPVTWGEVLESVVHNFTHKMPLADLYRIPGGKTTSWRLEYEIRLFLSHILPAHMLDWACALIGRRGRMVKIYEKIMKVLNTLEYFYTNQWDFQSKMALILRNQLSKIDSQQFYIDVTDIDWSKYFEDYHWGVRKYIFKEDPSNLSVARRVHLKRRFLIGTLDFVLIAFVIRLVISRIRIGGYIWIYLTAILKGALTMMRSTK